MSITITNTNASSTTQIISGKDIQIQCPKTAEQKDTEIFDQQQKAAEASFTQKTEKQASSIEDQKDEDYNPEEETELESEDVSSDEQSEQSENEYKNSESEEIDEDEIVNSREYQQEFAAAIQNVCQLAKQDGERIIEEVTQDYFDEFGTEPTEQEITDALQTCAIAPNQEESVEEQILNSKEFQEEFAKAIENVEYIAKIDGERILEKVSQNYFDECEDDSTDASTESDEEESTEESESEASYSEEEQQYETEEEFEYESEEEEIINSKEFQEEFAEAIEHIEQIAKIDAEAIFEKVSQDYFEETGQEITEAIMESDEDESVAESVSEEEEEWEVEYEVELDQEEFAEALQSVRELGKFHQEEFVSELCDTFVDLNGCEPTIEQLENVFGRIKASFADEAREEFIEYNDAESDSDSDYEANGTEFNQIEKDNKCDNKQKTQIVFVDNDTESESDSEYDSEEEEESEYTDSGVEYSQEEVSDDDDNDDENDSDYSPEKDSFDYTQDDKDNEQFKIELNGTDENEVECDNQDTIDIQ